MSFFKAFLKHKARNEIDRSCDREIQQVKKDNYLKNGREMKKAKRQGKFFDGSKELSRKNSESIRKIENKRSNRKKFIDDL